MERNPLVSGSATSQAAFSGYQYIAPTDLSQNILQCEVGEDGGGLAQHADELLCRVLHVGILEDVDASIHLVFCHVYRNGPHAFFQDGGRFG